MTTFTRRIPEGVIKIEFTPGETAAPEEQDETQWLDLIEVISEMTGSERAPFRWGPKAEDMVQRFREVADSARLLQSESKAAEAVAMARWMMSGARPDSSIRRAMVAEINQLQSEFRGAK